MAIQPRQSLRTKLNVRDILWGAFQWQEGKDGAKIPRYFSLNLLMLITKLQERPCILKEEEEEGNDLRRPGVGLDFIPEPVVPQPCIRHFLMFSLALYYE